MSIWTHQINSPSDLEPVNNILRQLIGQPWWKAMLSYGDELRLDMGEKQEETNPKLRDREKGAWILGLRTSEWKYEINGQEVISSESDSDAIKDYFKSMSNLIVTNFSVLEPILGLTLKFSNNGVLTAMPDEDEDELAYWELFTPFDTLLEVGPGKTISYKRSDVPLG